jgi:hypothetical protein
VRVWGTDQNAHPQAPPDPTPKGLHSRKFHRDLCLLLLQLEALGEKAQAPDVTLWAPAVESSGNWSVAPTPSSAPPPHSPRSPRGWTVADLVKQKENYSGRNNVGNCWRKTGVSPVSPLLLTWGHRHCGGTRLSNRAGVGLFKELVIQPCIWLLSINKLISHGLKSHLCP